MDRYCFACLLAASLSASLSASPAAAQLAGPTLLHPSPAPQKKAQSPEKAVKACPEYGAGYRRLDGTDICVKIGGYVRMQGSANAR